VATAARFADPAYDPSCEAPAGKVTVSYQADQSLFFSQVVGVSSPKVVRAQATATWGGAGGATNIAPLMLSMGRLSLCDIPYGVQVGDHCFFWWDNGTGSGSGSQTLTTAEWGLMNLNKWGVTPGASCSGNVSQSDVTNWITYGYPGSLSLADPPPTYVCRGNGFQGQALNNDIDCVAVEPVGDPSRCPTAGQPIPFPVNDPSMQVDSTGALCRPGMSCTVDKYAIVGFAMLAVVQVWKGNDAKAKCGQTSSSGNGSLRCLEAEWMGFQSGGLIPGGGQNFGLIAVTLSG
jgi:hypothetical protein